MMTFSNVTSNSQLSEVGKGRAQDSPTAFLPCRTRLCSKSVRLIDSPIFLRSNKVAVSRAVAMTALVWYGKDGYIRIETTVNLMLNKKNSNSTNYSQNTPCNLNIWICGIDLKPSCSPKRSAKTWTSVRWAIPPLARSWLGDRFFYRRNQLE